MAFHLDIVTPQREVYSHEADSITVPTTQGTVGVLPKHTNLFSLLTEGEIKIQEKNKSTFLAIGGGFMEVSHDRVLILVSRAVHADELNEAEIKKAQTEARDLLKQKGKIEERAAAQAMLRRSVIEMAVLRRHKKRQPPLI